MLAHLLSSKPKSKLINLFLAHPRRSFSPTELKVSASISTQFLKQTLRELVKMEFLLIFEKKKHKYFQVNRHFALFPELINMLHKNKVVSKDLLAQNALKVGECKLIALTGVFAGKPRIETDILFVGRISPRKLEKFLKLAEKFAEQEVSYTVFTNAEYEYRQIMNDRFLKNILENGPEIVLDKTKHRILANNR
jgi:DNA-binding HxlR family transcriptional regulator